MILYLHGFHSGPGSEKARLICEHFARKGRASEILAPQLPVHPADATRLILELARPYPANGLCLIGSSLGGYYSLYAAQVLGCRAVLINPAIRPYELLEDYLGWQTHPYTGERYEIRPEHLHDLQDLDVERIGDPSRFWLLTQTGDEVLDYRQGVEKLKGARQTVIEGGDHAFVDFADWLPAIERFADGDID